MDTLTAQLDKIVRQHIKLPDDAEPVPRDVSLVQLGLDSLSAVNLVLDLEDSFDIEFPDGMLTDATFYSFATLDATLRDLLVAVDGGRV